MEGVEGEGQRVEALAPASVHGAVAGAAGAAGTADGEGGIGAQGEGESVQAGAGLAESGAGVAVVDAVDAVGMVVGAAAAEEEGCIERGEQNACNAHRHRGPVSKDARREPEEQERPHDTGCHTAEAEAPQAGQTEWPAGATRQTMRAMGESIRWDPPRLERAG